MQVNDAHYSPKGKVSSNLLFLLYRRILDETLYLGGLMGESLVAIGFLWVLFSRSQLLFHHSFLW